MRHALSKQGYDRRAPVDLQLIRSSGTTIARPTCRWFRSPKKRAPSLSSKGSVLTSMLASEKQRRAVGSVSPHQSPINIRQPMPPKEHRRKQQPLITKLIDSLMQGQSESQDSIVGLVAKAAATTGGGSRSEDFSPTALTTADQQNFNFVAATDCDPVAMKRSVPLRDGYCFHPARPLSADS